MSENTTKPSTVDDEIDLGVVFRGIESFLINILKGILNIFRFYFRHKFILLGLVVLGIALGFFYEQSVEKTYYNDLLVTPNFGSSDYLYNKVEALESKLNQDDTLLLESIFGDKYELVKSIEINPVIDIYNFVSRNETNQSLFELLFEEEGNIEFIENPINSRNFNFHRIHLEVKGNEYHQTLSDALVLYLNNNTYFDELKTLTLENVQFELRENQSIINQIDSIITFAQKEKSFAVGSTGLTFSDNAGLNDLLGKKKGLIEQQKVLQSSLVNQSETIKVVDISYKILDKEDLLNKDKKKLFPLLLIIFYSIIFFIRYISKQVKAIIS